MDTPILKTFEQVNPTSNIYHDKTACFELHDCIIDLREFGKHAEHEQNKNIKVYCGNHRVRKYINRNPETNAVWYNEHPPTYPILDDYDLCDPKGFYIDQVIPEMFFCYDYLEWQYSHFLTDVFPKMWYYPQLKQHFRELKFGQIRPIVNFAYNLNDKTLKTKLNMVSDFAHQITDFYLASYGYLEDFVPLKARCVYKVNKLFIPVPFTSQDCIGWPKVQMDMYDLLAQVAERTVTKKFPEKVFISRKDTTKKGWFNLRHCVNEDEIAEALAKEGFESIELMPLNIFEKIKVFMSAKKIVQLVGSNCFNTVFTKPGTTAYTLLHPYYVGWSPMLESLSTARQGKFVGITDGIEMLGLDGYPAEYKREPDQPWRYTKIDELVKIVTA